MENYKAQYYNEALLHYGVKGMKWGVRKRRVKNHTKALGGAMARKTTHPYKTKNAIKEMNKGANFKTKLRRSTIGLSTKELKSLNKNVDKSVMDSRLNRVDKKTNKLKNREAKQNARILKDLSTRGSTTINPFNDPDITSGKIKYNKVKRASIKAGDNIKTRKLKLKKEVLNQRITKVNQRFARTGTMSMDTYRQYRKDWTALDKVEKKLAQKKKKK